MAERAGHVMIDTGKWYKVDLGSYRVRDVADFSPRSSTPGGGIIFSEMSLYQPLNQTDWRHGFGFHWHTDAAGYQETIGSIDTRQAGIAMLHTAREVSDVDFSATNGGFMAPPQGAYLLAWGGVGVHKFTVATEVWTNISSLGSGTINFVWTNGTYVFACPDGARIKKSNAADLETWTDAGVNANSADYKWLIGHDGFVYAGKDGTNQVYFASEEDLSDLHGDPGDDPTVISVGPKGRSVIGAVSFGGDLFFLRVDGLFKMDKDRSAARRVLDYSDQIHPDNFRSVAVYNGSLYFAIRNQLYQWNGTRVASVTPPRLNDSYPYTSYTKFDCFNVVGNYLYMIAKTSDTNGYYDMLCFDGVGWHKLHRFAVAAATDQIQALRYLYGSGNSTNDWLFYHHFSLTASTSGLYLFRLRKTDEFPFANFPTTGQHSLITSKFDAGFRRIQKSTPSLLLEASNLSAGHYYLKVYYRLNNDTAWTAWGGTDGVTNLVTAAGVTELSNPTGTTGSTLEYYWIQFRIDFITDSATQSPILDGLTVRLLMRPETTYGYAFDILLEQDAEFGVQSGLNRDPKAMLIDLRAARDSKAPITFTDLFGDNHRAYVTSVSELATEWKPEGVGPSENIQHRVSVNVVTV
jgi:hypothetical protein